LRSAALEGGRASAIFLIFSPIFFFSAGGKGLTNQFDLNFCRERDFDLNFR
jgi:hypothetical protein